ncbi:hypothetical protein HPB51_016000 [Rhipicephalus microplus]|uniref:Uncharacterized protein n=1 Tax=Rhipicephalus microplus TaxID=6941 RepID=A0A9J6DHB6_RHIMP|nr:hypothetical protein HPB51_016000 [Rhipicephalus microplus]
MIKGDEVSTTSKSRVRSQSAPRGTQIGIIPASCADHRRDEETCPVQAFGNSAIRTYGQRSLTLRLRHTFRWIFIPSNVSQAVLGADFLSFFNLAGDMHTHRLINLYRHLSINGIHSALLRQRDFELSHPPRRMRKYSPSFPTSRSRTQESHRGSIPSLTTLSPLDFPRLHDPVDCLENTSPSPAHRVASRSKNWLTSLSFRLNVLPPPPSSSLGAREGHDDGKSGTVSQVFERVQRALRDVYAANVTLHATVFAKRARAAGKRRRVMTSCAVTLTSLVCTPHCIHFISKRKVACRKTKEAQEGAPQQPPPTDCVSV